MDGFFSYRPNDLTRLPRREQNTNKGSFGRVLVIGGTRGMSGAVYFSAKAAYRIGCGLVQILTHEDNRAVLQMQLPEAIVSTYGENVRVEHSVLSDAIARADVIVVGVGLGQSVNALELLKITLSESEVPLIIDADALNLLSGNEHLWELVSAPVIITPHPLEMARLCHTDVSIIQRDRMRAAINFSEKYALICVLKGHETVVSDGSEAGGAGDEQYLYLNHSGNSGMATGGSGDVLTGVIAGLLAQRMRLFEAACLGVYIHGLAGDAAAERLGEYSVMASDIIDSISDVIRDCHDEE